MKLPSRGNPDYELQLVTKAGELVSVDEYIKLCDEPQPPDMEPCIQLTGKMTNVSFISIHRTSDTKVSRQGGNDEPALKDGVWAVLPFTGDVVSYSFLYLDDRSLEGETGFNLPVMVLETGARSREKNTVALVLREKYGYYERVGLLKMSNAMKPAAEDNSRTNDVQQVIYKDTSGYCLTHAPICEPEKRIWLEEKTVRLW